jgi:hypothetical protein
MWARDDDAGARVGWSRGHNCDGRVYLLFLLRDRTTAVTTHASHSAVGGGWCGGTAALLGRVAVDFGVWARDDDAGARVGWSRGHSCDRRVYLLFLLRDRTTAVTTHASHSAVGGGWCGGTAALLGRVAVDFGV